MENSVIMRDITKCYDGVTVLDRVNVEFFAGEIHALMGENGAGKSTLMNILAGVRAPDEGTVTVFGEDIGEYSVNRAEELGVVMIHQELLLMGDLTAAQG